MNIYFVYHLGTSREFFSSVEAFVFLPTIIATALGPMLAARLGITRTMTAARYFIPVTTTIMALTTIPLAGASTYWLYKALFAMAQPLWFAYAMDTATPKAKVAVSAWLEITFWIGIGFAARLTGGSFAQSNYTLPFFLSAAAALVTAILIHIFVGSRSALHPRKGEGVS
jgi:predicted MFS family arabinose efflux permease